MELVGLLVSLLVDLCSSCFVKSSASSARAYAAANEIGM
jgi:hypothetical protein